MANQSSSGQSGNYPLDNLTYDLITILHEKSKGLEAFDKYMKDAQKNSEIRQMLEQIRSQDEQMIQQLQQHLATLLGQSAGGGATRKATASEPNVRKS